MRRRDNEPHLQVVALLGREAVQGHVGVELQDVLLQLVLLQLHSHTHAQGCALRTEGQMVVERVHGEHGSDPGTMLLASAGAGEALDFVATMHRGGARLAPAVCYESAGETGCYRRDLLARLEREPRKSFQSTAAQKTTVFWPHLVIPPYYYLMAAGCTEGSFSKGCEN